MAHTIFRDNSITTFAATVSAVATSVTTEDGSLLPAPTTNQITYATLKRVLTGEKEVISYTDVTGNVVSGITRNVTGTGALSFGVGDSIEIRIPNVVLSEFIQRQGDNGQEDNNVTGDLLWDNAAGPSIRNVAADGTVPTLIPNRAKPGSGMGWTATDQVCLIANSVQILRLSGNDCIIAPASGMVRAGVNNGPALINENATNINPTLIPSRLELDTGWGWSSDALWAVLGGAAQMSLSAADGDELSLYNYVNDGTFGPQLTLHRARSGSAGGGGAAGVIDDVLGKVRFVGYNNAGTPLAKDYGTIAVDIIDPASTAELGAMRFGVIGAITAGSNADLLELYAGGTPVARWQMNANVFNASFAAGPALVNETVSHLNPTLIPERSDLGTGVGHRAASTVTLIGQSFPICDFVGAAAAAANHLIITNSSAELDPVKISTATDGAWSDVSLLIEPFQNGVVTIQNQTQASGLHFLAANLTAIGTATDIPLTLSAKGSEWVRQGTGLGIRALNAAAGALPNVATSTTIPTLVPNWAELGTGFGWVSNELHGILGNFQAWTMAATQFYASGANQASIMREASSAVNPTLVPDRSELGTGLGGTLNNWSLIRVGVEQLTGSTGLITASVDMQGSNAAGPAIMFDEAATLINPTLIVNKAELDTGWGWASDQLSAVLGGIKKAVFAEAPSELTLYNVDNDSFAGPSLFLHRQRLDTAAAVDGDFLGELVFQGYSDNATPVKRDFARIVSQAKDSADLAEEGELFFAVMQAGALTNQISMDSARTLFANSINMSSNTITDAGDISVNQAAGPILRNVAATTTVPTLCPNRAETDVGWGWASDILVAILAGANEYSFSPTTAEWNDNILNRAVIKDYGITHNVANSSAGTVTYDYSAGQSFVTTFSENITTVTVTNPPASGTYGEFVVKMIQDSDTAKTITYGAAYLFQGGTHHAMSTGLNDEDYVTFRTIDGGTTWYVDWGSDYS